MSWREFLATILCVLAGFGIVNLIWSWSTNPAEFNEGEDAKFDYKKGEQPSDHKQSTRDQMRPWWLVLEVKQTATEREIQASYHTKIRQYHPDRVDGLGEEFATLAESRAKELNRAYAEAKRQRGFS